MTETSVDPFFTIHRLKHADTSIDDLQLVFTCVQPTPDCKAPTPDLVVLATLGGEFTNLSGTTRLELDGHGHATLRPVGVPDIPFATLTYRFVQNGKPDRITLQAANPEDADKFAKAMGNTVENFAFVDYEDQVTVGFAEPANTTTTVFAGYNRVAANDLLTLTQSATGRRRRAGRATARYAEIDGFQQTAAEVAAAMNLSRRAPAIWCRMPRRWTPGCLRLRPSWPKGEQIGAQYV